MYQINKIHLRLHNVIYQLYLNKAGKNSTFLHFCPLLYVTLCYDVTKYIPSLCVSLNTDLVILMSIFDSISELKLIYAPALQY